MLTQLLRQLATLKQQHLQAKAERNRQEIAQLDRQIQQCNEAIEQRQKALKRNQN